MFTAAFCWLGREAFYETVRKRKALTERRYLDAAGRRKTESRRRCLTPLPYFCLLVEILRMQPVNMMGEGISRVKLIAPPRKYELMTLNNDKRANISSFMPPMCALLACSRATRAEKTPSEALKEESMPHFAAARVRR